MRATTADLRDRLQAAVGDAYAIERELAGGAMSRLFLATERSLDRRVVVKVLPPELASEVSAARFQREVQLTAHLQHPHVLPVLAAGARDGLLYYVMPYVEGESLRHRLERDGRLPIGDAVRVIREVADALAFAHERGVVHRDVKPENVLLQGGHGVLADFGIAHALEAARTTETKLTETGKSVGTPGYMAPEQVAGEPVIDGRADVYALAVVGYEMLAGHPPFAGASQRALVAAHLTEPPPALDEVRAETPPPVCAAIAKALAKAPDDRFATAAEFRDALEPPSGEPSPRLRRSAWLLAGLGVAAALTSVSLLRNRMGESSHLRAAARTTWDGVAPGAARSVAVLPFLNMTAGGADEYLSDGMTEELISTLSKLEGIRVPSRTTVFAFKGRRLSAREIGESLSVRAVLEGSVRKVGERIRVTAQLIDVTSDSHVWAESYERDTRDVLAVQEEIARAIASKLRVRLAGREEERLVRRPTADHVAYDLYLQGLYALNKQTARNFEESRRGLDFEEARVALEGAVRRDRRFAVAYAELASVYNQLAAGGAYAPKLMMPKARATALRALALDGTLAQAHAALAYVELTYDWNWSAAERRMRRALELDPRYSAGHRRYAYMLARVGRFDEAVGHAERAIALDPIDRVTNVDLGIVLLFTRNPDRAIEHARQMLIRDSTHVWGHRILGHALRQKGLLQEAALVYDRMGAIADARLMRGQRDSMLARIDRQKIPNRNGYVWAFSVALDYAAIGDRDRAFEWLAKAYQQREGDMIGVRTDPRLDSLRSDPRFERLVRRVGVQ